MNIIIASLIVLAVIASVLAQDFSAFYWAYWQEGGSNTSRSEVVRNLGLLAAGVIGLGFGIWRAYTAYCQTRASQRQAEAANEQARIAEQGHITDRFSTAVEHLGSEQLTVRLGGIYALWRLIEDSPKRDVTSVIDILCAFVRNPPHESSKGRRLDVGEDGHDSAEKAGATNEIRPDVQTILNLIANEEADYHVLLPVGYRLDLIGANLTSAQLVGANLISADLMHANLTDADLSVADLTDAALINTNLSYANLMEADLSGASLIYADFSGANLWRAKLTDATLNHANLAFAENLTQQQLDVTRYDPHDPPELPSGLVLPKPRQEYL